ncbi:MAG TPA: hypothetical protein VHA35_15545 [Dongiaceae bacterium]|nr:hypothetical protein [Dongiaceae bacterium]
MAIEIMATDMPASRAKAEDTPPFSLRCVVDGTISSTLSGQTKPKHEVVELTVYLQKNMVYMFNSNGKSGSVIPVTWDAESIGSELTGNPDNFVLVRIDRSSLYLSVDAEAKAMHRRIHTKGPCREIPYRAAPVG